MAIRFLWKKPEYSKKTTDLPQVTDKLLSHNVGSSTPRHERDSNSQLLWWLEIIAEIVVIPTTIYLFSVMWPSISPCWYPWRYQIRILKSCSCNVDTETPLCISGIIARYIGDKRWSWQFQRRDMIEVYLISYRLDFWTSGTSNRIHTMITLHFKVKVELHSIVKYILFLTTA